MLYKIQDVNSGLFLATWMHSALTKRGKTWRYRKWAEYALGDASAIPRHKKCKFVIVTMQ
jgi:hypothetical protein